MADVRGQLLPIYMVADESASMEDSIDELNAGLASLHAALLAEPMAAAKVRFSVLGFSDDVVVRLHLADVRRSDELPALESRGRTNYAEVFETLLRSRRRTTRCTGPPCSSSATASRTRAARGARPTGS